MADISKITATDGTTYNIKDAGAARTSHTHTLSFGDAGTHSTDYALTANTRYEFKAGGSSVIIQTPPNTVTTATTTGSGNAVTSITASNGALTVTKGSTFLTSHQDISGKADKANITAGTAGTSSATSGSTLAVPYVTMNAQGIVTGYGTHTHTVTGFSTTDTKNTVGATSTSTQKYYPVGVLSSGTGQTYAQSYYDPYFYVEDGYVTADKLTSNGDVIAKGKVYVGGTTAYIKYNSTTGAMEFNV